MLQRHADSRLSECVKTIRPAHDLVASLGTNCALTYNLRHFYGLSRTGLLDWTITPLACLPGLIRRRFEFVDSWFAGSLVQVQVGAADSVMHVPTGILLQHAFRRNWRGRVSSRWRSEVGAVADKFAFLGSRMDAWMREAKAPALFLNGTGWHEALSDDLTEAAHRADIYDRIITAFRETYPGADPTFYLLNGHAASVDRVIGRPDVRIAKVGNYGRWHEGKKGHYAGCKLAWREALDALNVSAA